MVAALKIKVAWVVDSANSAMTRGAATPMDWLSNPSKSAAAAHRAKVIRAWGGSSLIGNVLLTLETEHLTRLGRRCHLAAHFGQYAFNLLHLLGIGFGQFAAFDEQTVLQTHAHVASHERGLCQKRHLMPTRREHRPLEIGGSK